ncbi:MAG: PAS domain-containing sensor histidine kinase [Armatimonadetes bacterium]|nr:PAS domain-containing sensor histidine kinase [Armatimonadota bacterium]
MEELTERSIESLVDRMCIVDSAHRFLLVGRHAAQALGRDPDTLIGKRCRDVGLPAEIIDELEPLLQRVSATGLPAKTEFSPGLIDRQARIVESHVNPIVDHDQVVAFVIICRDRSERGEGDGTTTSQRQLDRARCENDSSEQSQSILGRPQEVAEDAKLKLALDIVSHEFRSPLSAILFALRAIASHDHALSRESMQMMADEALSEAERMDDMIGHMLDMTRLRTRKITATFSPISVLDFLDDALASNANRLRGRPIAAAVMDPPEDIYTDGALLLTVLRNLLDNAVKFSPSDSPIEVGAKAENGKVIIYVADRGEGLSQEYLNRVFEIGFQVPRQDEAHRAGLGVGLPLCKLIMEELRGDICVEQRPGGGLIASLTVPRYGECDET